MWPRVTTNRALFPSIVLVVVASLLPGVGAAEEKPAESDQTLAQQDILGSIVCCDAQVFNVCIIQGDFWRGKDG